MNKTCSICGNDIMDDVNRSSFPFNDGQCCQRCNEDVNDYRIARSSGLEFPPVIEVVLKTGIIIYLYSTRYHYGRINSSRKVLAWDFLDDLPKNTSISFANCL